MTFRFFPLPRRLGSRLSLWFSGISILLTLVLMEVVDITATDAMRDQIGAKLAELAYQTTDKLDQGMYERYREVLMLSRRPELADPATGLDRKQALLDRLQADYPAYAWLGLVDPSGTVLAASQGILAGVNTSKRPWFDNALRGIHVGDVHDAVLLASKLPSMPGEPWRFVDIAFPFTDAGGKVAGLLSVHMSWTWAKDLERSMFDPIRKRSNTEVMIINSHGTVLLGPPSLQGRTIGQSSFSEAALGKNSFVVEKWPDGKSYLVGYNKTRGHASYPGLGWSVLVRQDVTEAFAPVQEIQRHMLWSGLGIAFLFSLFGWFSARRITSPLAMLANAAKRVQRGESRCMAAPAPSYVEVDEMGEAFAALVADLQKNEDALKLLNASLETRVLERTAALAFSEDRLRMIADNMPVLIAYADMDERCQYCNTICADWFGRAPAEVTGMRMEHVFDAKLYAAIQPHIRQALEGKRVTFERSRNYRDSIQHMKITCIPDRLKDGEVRGLYLMAQDITELKVIQIGLQHDVMHDSLTKLPNRHACMNQIESAMARVRRSGLPCAVMFLDVNKFKQINDSHGHYAGDKVLIEFARRLQRSVRESDTVARLAGDEFVIVAEGLANGMEDALMVGAKVLDAFIAPLELEDATLHVSTSIGIMLYHGGPASAEDLLRKADQAMYEAKTAGTGKLAFHDGEGLQLVA